MQPLISVIVPMYNAQKYIDRCLTSLIGQTLNNIQILLVNDGSTDETEKIAKEYEKRDKRIIVISINRSGPGVARNIGIDKAEGEYIAFVDVDDWIEEDALEKLYLSAKNSDADIAVCGFIREVIDVQGNTYSIEVYPFKDNNGSIFTKKDLADRFIERLNFSAFHTIYSKLYRKEILDFNNIRIPGEITLGEDLLFNLAVYKKVDKVCWLKECLYHYTWDEKQDSLSKKYRKDLFEVNRLLHMSIMEHMEFWNIASVENKLSVNREFFMKIYASVKQELKTKKSIYLKAKKLYKISTDNEVRKCINLLPLSLLNIKELVLFFLIKYKLVPVLALLWYKKTFV